MRPGFVTGFRCYVCGWEGDFAFPFYRCPCGGNVSLQYDYEAIRKGAQRPTAMQLAQKGHFAYESLLPVTPKGMNAFRLQVGNSPLIRRDDMGLKLGVGKLLFKDDTRLPSASFKDRASSVLLAMAAERKLDVVSTASTGNAGCSMACLCADAGISAVVFVPHTAPKAKIAQLLFYGATVVKVEGSYDDAFDLCWEVSREKGWLNRSTGWNPFTREGKKTVSFEIAQQMDWDVPDLVFVPVGDGNIISGVWKGFTDLQKAGFIDRLPRLVAVQSSTSNAIYLGWKEVMKGSDVNTSVPTVSATTRADSISVDFPRDGVAAVRAVVDSGGEAVQVDDEEIMKAIPRLAGEAGIFAEPAGAAAFAGLRHWLGLGNDASQLSVACLVTGNGLKDPEAGSAHLRPALTVAPDKDSALKLL
jgi:threonine synthase